jgi:hypothetical protein
MIKSRRMRWAWNVARMWENRNAYKILVGETVGKRPLGRTRYRWMNNIKMNFIEIHWGGIDSIDVVQRRDQWRALVNTVMTWEILE